MSLRRHLPLAVLLVTGSAAAAPGRRITVDVPAQPQASGPLSHTIVLDRCRGGCEVNKNGSNNATEMASTIPQGNGPFNLREFATTEGKTGADADPEWTALLTCVREVYSAYDITVTDERPTNATYHLALVAGAPSDIGLPNDILGIAPLAGDCSPQDNVISFSFANAHGGADRISNLCWTVAQESAHAFGLDHEYEFVDGTSTCTDPMTYRNDCGGQRFFRNKAAQCGEFSTRACKCATTQNSHAKLLALFGAGDTLIAPPTAAITFPQPNAPTLGAVVGAQAGSQRGVAKVDLLINGFSWTTVPGLPAGPTGQANPGAYNLNVPANLPKSIVDIVVRASDDLGAYTDSPPITVTNGMPCETASTCAAHQKCDAGRCLWDAPVGDVGDECTYAQFCKSNMCVETSSGKYCSEACTPDTNPTTCPDDLVCATASPGQGLCVPADSGGCCSTGSTGGTGAASGGLALLVAGWITRRRARFAGVRMPRPERDESC